MAAVKVYTSDNYIIVEEDSKVFEYAKGYTYYTFVGSTYTIKETVGGEYKFTQAQITAGDVRKEDNSSYTEESFKTFLRQNTGFKTAAGGSAATPIGALLTQTGQTTSYRTGDNPTAGRATSFGVLLGNNPFGNDKRFTDELGGQTYTKNIVIDWSTYDGTNVLGYKRTNTNVVSGGWNNAIDTCLAISIASYTTGWRLANVNEWNSIMNRELSNPLGYSPFTSFTFTFSSHTSTTYKPASAAYCWGVNSLGNIFAKDKNENSSCLAVRTFTVTGTTLS